MPVKFGKTVTATRRAVLGAAAAGVAGAAIAPAADAAVPTAPDLTVTRVVPVRAAALSLNGARLPQSTSLFTPIRSDADAVYVADSIAEPQWWTITDRHPRARSGVWRLPKNGSAASFTEIVAAVEFDGTNPGHRGASVTVTDAGRVLVQPPLHKLVSRGGAGWRNAPLAVSASRTSHDVSSFSAVPAPAGARTGVSYSRFFRDSASATTYLLIRGSDYQALLWTWDETARVLRPLHREDTRYDPAQPDGYGVRDGLSVHPTTGLRTGAYGHELAFFRPTGATSSTIWCAAEFRINTDADQSGFPRRDVALARSDDQGRTWKHPGTGVTAAQLFRPSVPAPANANVLVVFDGPAYSASASDDARHDSVGARVGVASGGRVVVVATWSRRPADSSDSGLAVGTPVLSDYRSLWAAIWDPTTKTLERICLYNPGSRRSDGTWTSNHHAGMPSLVSSRSGTIVVVASSHDDHEHWPGRENWGLVSDDGRPTAFPADARLHVYATSDGRSWTDSAVAGPTGLATTGTSGAYLDPECLDGDGLLRLYPAFPNDPARAEVWELPAPSVTTLSRRLDRPALTARALSGGVAVSWTPPASDAGSSISQFVLHAADGTRANSASPAVAVLDGATRGWIDRAAPAGAPRSYVVFARNAAGTSLASNTATATNGAVDVVRPPDPAPQYWFRASDLPLRAGDRVASVPAAPGALVRTAAVQSVTSRQPRLIADGPGGLPALRFERAAASALLLPAPLRFGGTTTVLMVARVRDEEWSHLAAATDADGTLLVRAPFSRVSAGAHETRSAGAATDGTQGLATADTRLEIVHRVESAAGIGAWKVYVSQWRVDPWSKLRVSGQINRCGSSQIELPATAGAVLTGADEPTSTQMMIGSARARTGDVLTSAVDIAEILRFDGSMSRERIQDVVLYLLARHRLPSTNVVESELRRRWDRGTPPDCLDVVRTDAAMAGGSTAGALQHDSCSRLLPTGTYSPA
ncbi:hypothetical protein C5C45_05915 [Rathayibacter rathayi]|uniref:hypothetical protein n=1 Tax=Rathayibacter rathayi TaxID=33887 RepID=UPI000CE7CCC2|nr:hypothetical protein [Rathayibacter rathayi]PPH69398.1 hypothetical protein C5C45_05915 [Rathayibacter rathayi]